MPAPGDRFEQLEALRADAMPAAEALRVAQEFAAQTLKDRHLARFARQLRQRLDPLLGEPPTEAPCPSGRRLSPRQQRALGPAGSQSAARQTGDGLAEPRGRGAPSLRAAQQLLAGMEARARQFDWALAAHLKQLGRACHALQLALRTTYRSLERLSDVRLYVLLDGRDSAASFVRMAETLIQAGVHAIQLRDKNLSDRALVDRAGRLCQLARAAPTLVVINDRPDIAQLVGADGVHVGQEEMHIGDVRRLVGRQMLAGVSTHSIDQARQAVREGADLIGVGPTFASRTKHFDHLAGLDLLRQVAEEIRLPAFAIGGIDGQNLARILATGVSRVAVGAAITGSSDPLAAARSMLAQLERCDADRPEWPPSEVLPT